MTELEPGDRIVANRATFPLFDTVRFTRDVEAALLRAWAAIGGNPQELPPTMVD